MKHFSELQYFEETEVNGIYILKVLGGYIYSRNANIDTEKPAFGVFVPDNQEKE